MNIEAYLLEHQRMLMVFEKALCAGHKRIKNVSKAVSKLTLVCAGLAVCTFVLEKQVILLSNELEALKNKTEGE